MDLLLSYKIIFTTTGTIEQIIRKYINKLIQMDSYLTVL